MNNPIYLANIDHSIDLLIVSFDFFWFPNSVFFLFPNCSDYQRMDENDQYELVALDESLEDERNLHKIMAGQRAVEAEVDARYVRTGAADDIKLDM
jgi:hypothetical protein